MDNSESIRDTVAVGNAIRSLRNQLGLPPLGDLAYHNNPVQNTVADLRALLQADKGELACLRKERDCCGQPLEPRPVLSAPDYPQELRQAELRIQELEMQITFVRKILANDR